jgi:hypothetical protein
VVLQLEVSQSELDLYLSNQKQETNKLNELERKRDKLKESIEEKTRYGNWQNTKFVPKCRKVPCMIK